MRGRPSRRCPPPGPARAGPPTAPPAGGLGPVAAGKVVPGGPSPPRYSTERPAGRAGCGLRPRRGCAAMRRAPNSALRAALPLLGAAVWLCAGRGRRGAAGPLGAVWCPRPPARHSESCAAARPGSALFLGRLKSLMHLIMINMYPPEIGQVGFTGDSRSGAGSSPHSPALLSLKFLTGGF